MIFWTGSDNTLIKGIDCFVKLTIQFFIFFWNLIFLTYWNENTCNIKFCKEEICNNFFEIIIFLKQL